jgi:hypothetical protein
VIRKPPPGVVSAIELGGTDTTEKEGFESRPIHILVPHSNLDGADDVAARDGQSPTRHT